jgi:hypothetical protein
LSVIVGIEIDGDVLFERFDGVVVIEAGEDFD